MEHRLTSILDRHRQQNWRERLDRAVLDYCAKENVKPQDAVEVVSDFLRDGSVVGQRLTASELHHRTKNEMQLLISSMRHRRRSGDVAEKASCNACIGQALALQQLNDILDVEERQQTIDLATQCISLVTATRDAFDLGENVQIEIKAKTAVLVPQDVARNVLLILNEALTNVIKHAFADGGGTVRIELALTFTGKVQLVVADDGCAPEQPASEGSGSSLIDALASQIDGRIYRSRNRTGFRLVCAFPLDRPLRPESKSRETA